MSNYAKEACKTIFSIKDMLHPLSSFILQSHWGNQDKILIWQQLSGRSYWHKVNKFILGQLIWVQQVCSGWKFYCKKNFLSPYIVRCLPHGSFSPSGRRANLHLVRFAKAFVSLKIQIFILQKQLLPTPKSICQSHVANFVSLIFSLLPTFHPSVALNSFEISWNRNIVQNCPLLHWCHVKCQLN